MVVHPVRFVLSLLRRARLRGQSVRPPVSKASTSASLALGGLSPVDIPLIGTEVAVVNPRARLRM